MLDSTLLPNPLTRSGKCAENMLLKSEKEKEKHDFIIFKIILKYMLMI